jgi:hypothetical protein
MAYLFRGRIARQSSIIGMLTGAALIGWVLLVVGERATQSAAGPLQSNVIATPANYASAREQRMNAASLSPTSLFLPTAAQVTDPFAPCVPAAANSIACENSKTGNPSTEWDISGAGSDSIQGFATNISVNRGETVRFKIRTVSPNYKLDIYRLGYYGGMGARKITTVEPSAALPQNQPGCLNESSTGLIDCGNWAESANWAVPSNATSGIYIARLAREDGTTGVSHIIFIVRDDAGGSDLLFQTSDTTWQAYNQYGGNSLYGGAPVGRAYKVSYNRPFSTRQGETSHDWVFDGEYPMVRWLEANSFNVSYSTGVDTDRRGAELLEHKVFLSVGHDEYWSNDQRARVDAARNAGVHLAFFSGNTMFWKTRWENSIDGSGTSYRTLVCYKDTHANAKIDPLPGVWTGTWRDPRFSPPADGGRPENGTIGTMFSINGPAFDSIRVSDQLGKLRFWRNTTVAAQTPGQTATVGAGTVGYEWDEDYSNAARPVGLIRLSSNTVNSGGYLLDYGSNYGNGTATHSLTLYRHLSGALVFSAASVRWSWGLDNRHDQSEAPSIPQPDTRMRQATINLFADMGVQPATLQSGLVAATQSLDNLPPTSLIAMPAAGSIVQAGNPVNISGSAVDNGGGVVAAVNISLDGGASWKRATGTESWSYSWTPTVNGPATIRVVAIDDNGNRQSPISEVTVTVGNAPVTCPCSLWTNATTPAVISESDSNAVELGVKFQSTVSGWITGLRFYKGATNTGVHLGSLWTAGGSLLSSVTFTGESASGWQQMSLPAPIAVNANTTYVASYHTTVGHYSVNDGYFSTTGFSRNPLIAPAAGDVAGNGVYRYGAGGFPSDTFGGSNYWVDVVFSTTPPAGDTTPPTISSFTPAAGATGVNVAANVTAIFSEALDAATVNNNTVELRDAANALVTATVGYDAATRTVTLDPAASLVEGAVYTARIRGGAADPRIKDLAGNALAADATWSFTTATTTPPQCPCSLWSNSVVPAVPASTETRGTEVGLKFQSNVSGWVTGIRFYKGTGNTGTHTGSLWSITGTLLSRVTFTGESATGWQQMSLTTPVAITANTTYVVSYHTNVGRFAYTNNYFATTSYSNGPLRAPVSSEVGGNGVYRFGGIVFPTTSNQRNFWVDVVFSTTSPDTTPPILSSFTPSAGAAGVAVNANVTATFNEALDPATVNGSTIELRNAANALVAAAVSYNATTRTATLDPTASLAGGAVYTARIRGGSADPRVKDVAGNALAADATWIFTTAASDTTPPTVASFTPGAGATSVSVDANMTATFSEALDVATVSGSTVELRNAANALLAATVSYNAATQTVTVDPTTSLTAGAVYTVRVRGGSVDPRVKDVAGNALAADVSWSFTTATGQPGPTSYSLWSNTTTPAVPMDSDGSSVELGVKFQSDLNGVITGLRFYKGAANTGVHVGNLWTSAGALLASVTFTGETASGWQQMSLPTPVAINANTTYVASYHTNVGRYSADNNYFASTAVVNGPLRAPTSGAVGGNGVYRYGAGGFPTDTYQATNYYVDVVFATTVGADTTPPSVSSVSPTANAVGVSAVTNVSATFNEPMDATTINANTVELRDASNALVAASISYNATTRTVTLDPNATLTTGAVYTARIRGGAADPRVKDAAGNALAADFIWSFTTLVNTPSGSGGPILLITNPANQFTQYYKEILLAEGFNGFRAIDLGDITATVLGQYDIAILGETPLTAGQVSMLTAWVEGGGNLIAMRPDKQLASLLGLVDASSTRSDAYLRINTAQAPGAGIVDQTIQYHSPADLYTVVSATQVATLYSTAAQSTINPAVSLRPVGANGGEAAAFTFDLARSIVYTRQGNPSFAGQERDGVSPVRPNDQFFPDYVNLDKAAIPQADELQRLLANMILYMNTDQMPMPRFWYLPSMKKAVILMTGDDHGTAGGTKGIFDALLAASPQSCSVDNWECYRATSWLYTDSGLTNAEANAYRNQGFDLGVHVNTGCADWTPASLENFFTNNLAAFASKYPSLPPQKANRTHCLVWSDWATHPKVELNHGIRLDENYYYWPGSWIQNRPGFMTGSGWPMRFADLDGTTIDVYQAATHLVNENEITYPAGINAMLDKALGPEGYYGVFGTHYDHSDDFETRLLNSAISRNVSLISAQQLLTWLDGRNSSSFGAYAWDGTTLQFTISVGAGAANLYTMLPIQGAAGQLSSIAINGSPVTFTVETIKGRAYAVFRAANGTVRAVYNG